MILGREIEEAILLASNTGGSGKGMSFWSDAAVCGARAVQKERRKATQEAPTSLYTGKDKFAVGTAYHKLHELWHTTEPEITLDYNEPAINENVAEAFRLFEGWQKHWPKYLWGVRQGLELQIPSSPEVDLAIRGMFGGQEVTARLDFYVTMNELQVSEAENLRGVRLNGPGTYVVDLKTSDSPLEDIWYTNSLQAKLYPAALGLHDPTLDVKGIIFDIVYKFGRRKDKSVTSENFKAIFAPIEATATDYLQGLVAQGSANIERFEKFNQGNISACMQFGFGRIEMCPFFGSCDAK